MAPRCHGRSSVGGEDCPLGQPRHHRAITSASTVAIMCTNCVTSLDALAANMIGVTALGTMAKDRLLGVLTGCPEVERHQRTWDHNAAFLSSIEQDPVAVLGSRPGTDHRAELPEEPELSTR